MTSGHAYCYCERILVYANQDPVIKDQIQRHAKQQFELLTTAAFVMFKGKTRGIQLGTSYEQQARGIAKRALRMSFKKGYTFVLDRWTRNDVCRGSQLDIGWTEAHVEQRDRLTLENHTFHATKEEWQRYKHIWMRKRNTDG